MFDPHLTDPRLGETSRLVFPDIITDTAVRKTRLYECVVCINRKFDRGTKKSPRPSPLSTHRIPLFDRYRAVPGAPTRRPTDVKGAGSQGTVGRIATRPPWGAGRRRWCVIRAVRRTREFVIAPPRPSRPPHASAPRLVVSPPPFSASDRRRIKFSTPPRSTAACTARAPVARSRALGRTRSPSRNCTISDRPSGAEGSPRFAARRTKFTARITP